MQKNTIEAVRIIKLPRIYDVRGNLTFVQDDCQIPFAIKRAYWIYDVPAGSERGGHAHHEMQQMLVAVAGSFTIEVCDGFNSATFTLNRPFEGLLLPPGIWSTINNYSSGAVCLSLTDTLFEETDYIRDFDRFIELARQ